MAHQARSQVRENIYTDIPNQFPAFYREDGELFVEFVKAYYEFLDTRQNDFREAFTIRDIDSTYDRFLIYFKNKFLDNFPLKSETDIRFVIKHITDLYRRKGTEEGLRLLFRMFFNQEIEIVYPSKHILKPSDSKYGSNLYLEMKPIQDYANYPVKRGDRLYGDSSRSEAYVDEIVFKNFSGTIVPIVYLSNIIGTFTVNDGLRVTGARLIDGEYQSVTIYPGRIINGCMNDIQVNLTGARLAGNVPGDKVQLRSRLTGIEATGTVFKVSEAQTGVIEFSIKDGGFGYTTDAELNEVFTSTQVLAVPDGTDISTLKEFGVVRALGASTSAIDPEVPYSSSATITGSGTLINASEGLVHIRNTPGNSFPRLPDGGKVTLEYSDDTYSINWTALLQKFDQYLFGSVTSGDIFDFFEGSVGDRKRFDVNGDGNVNALDYQDLLDYASNLQEDGAVRDWIEDNIIKPLLDNLLSWDTTIYDPSNATTTIIKDVTIIKTFDVVSISNHNQTATYQIGDLSNKETVELVTDIIGNFVGVRLNSQNYGMSGSGFEKLDTQLKDAFTLQEFQIGTISSLFVTNTGQNYEGDVRSIVKQPSVANFDKKDIVIEFTENNFILEKGTIVTQSRSIVHPFLTEVVNGVETLKVIKTPGEDQYIAKAEFKFREGNSYHFKQISFYDFDRNVPVNVNGALKEIDSIRREGDSKAMGENAEIAGKARFAAGQVEQIRLLETGFRYRDGETVDVVNIQPTRNSSSSVVPNPLYNLVVCEAEVTVQSTGFTEGKWRTNTSFLNDSTQVIHDNDYYQEYSYDIQSIVSRGDFEDVVLETMSPAGTKMFASPLINTSNDVSVNADIEFTIFNTVLQPIVAEVTPTNFEEMLANTSPTTSEVLVAVLAELDTTPGEIDGGTGTDDRTFDATGTTFDNTTLTFDRT